MEIKQSNPISTPEAKAYLKENKELKAFLKKFTPLDEKKGKELREKLEALNMIKLGEKDLVKIINLLPEDAEDLNKVLTDVKLEEDETKKILETIKPFK